jgi:hypothetical protein
MSIQNELSSDIAVALLTGKDRDPQRLNDLKQVVLKVHSILQEASKDLRRKRTRAAAAGEKKPANQ